MKVCSKCKEEKSFDCFYIKKSTKDGHTYMCKICFNSDQALRYSKNPQHFRNIQTNWRKNNPEKEKAKGLKWRKNNPEKVKAREVNWKINNPEKVAEKYKRIYWNRPEFFRLKAKETRQKNIDHYKEYSKERHKINRSELNDMYIYGALRNKGFSREQIKQNPEILEIQKLIIKTKRLCKTSQN